jgi:two-component system chemotaxis response regulator CheY
VIAVSGLEAAKILEASDGQEALELLEKEWVDVILTDINMPRMDGEEFVRRLAERGLTQSIPIVVISTDATEVRREHLEELGARGYLVKPFHPEELREQIERVLSGTTEEAPGEGWPHPPRTTPPPGNENFDAA